MKYKILIVLAKFYEDLSKNLISGAKEKLKGKANIKNMILVTKSKKKVVGLEGYGIKITKQEIIK